MYYLTLFSYFCFLITLTFSTQCIDPLTNSTINLITIGDICADTDFAFPSLENARNYIGLLKLYDSNTNPLQYNNSILLVDTYNYQLEVVNMDYIVGVVAFKSKNGFPKGGNAATTYTRCFFHPNKPILLYDGEMESIDAFFQYLKDGYDNIQCSLEQDENPYLPYFRVFRYIHWVFDVPWNFINMILAIHVYLKLRSSVQFQLITKAALIIEVFIAIERQIYLIFYPLWSYTTVFSTYNYYFMQILITFSAPWALLTSLMVAFAWNILLHKLKELSDHIDLTRYKVAFIISSFVLFIVGYAGDIQRAFYLYMPSFLRNNYTFGVLLSGSIYGVLSLIIAFYFLYIGNRVLKLLVNEGREQREHSKSHSMYDDGISTMTNWLKISGVLMILSSFFSVFIGLSDYLYKEYIFNLVFTIAFWCQNGTSTTQILAFGGYLRISPLSRFSSNFSASEMVDVQINPHLVSVEQLDDQSIHQSELEMSDMTIKFDNVDNDLTVLPNTVQYIDDNENVN